MVNFQVLSMVQDGKLDVGGNSPQKLCLVAICYHNMAVSVKEDLRRASIQQSPSSYLVFGSPLTAIACGSYPPTLPVPPSNTQHEATHLRHKRHEPAVHILQSVYTCSGSCRSQDHFWWNIE